MTKVLCLQPDSKTKGGITYDKNVVADAITDRNYFVGVSNASNKLCLFKTISETKYETSEHNNENGYFISATINSNTNFLLGDKDGDNIFDSFRLSYTRNNKTTTWVDNEFDGIFDNVEYGSLNTSLRALDTDTDGTIDLYGYTGSSAETADSDTDEENGTKLSK